MGLWPCDMPWPKLLGFCGPRAIYLKGGFKEAATLWHEWQNHYELHVGVSFLDPGTALHTGEGQEGHQAQSWQSGPMVIHSAIK